MKELCMRALIRNRKSGRFYAGEWRWTARRERACDFASTFEALAYAEDHHLRGIEVLLTFGEPEFDLTVSPEFKTGQELEYRAAQRSH